MVIEQIQIEQNSEVRFHSRKSAELSEKEAWIS